MSNANNPKAPTVELFGVHVPRHILHDILNCAANAMYDRQKNVKAELADIDMGSDTRSVAFRNACANYDDAKAALAHLDAIEKALKAIPRES